MRRERRQKGNAFLTSQTESNYQCPGSWASFIKMLYEFPQDFWNIFEKISCGDKVLDDVYSKILGTFYKRRLCQVVVLKRIQVYHNTEAYISH